MQEIQCHGILFDMDGTLIDSTPAVESTLHQYCLEQGLDPVEFLRVSHGCRLYDTIKRCQLKPLGSTLTEEELNLSVRNLEVSIAENGKRAVEEGTGRGIESLPGAITFLSELKKKSARFGIVTSATRFYATSALATAGVEMPAFLVSADDVKLGKPHPEPYLKGLVKLAELPGKAFTPENILVFEDAPSGLKSGLAAGCRTMAVCTGQPLDVIRNTPATYKVIDLNRIELVKVEDGVITLRIKTMDQEV